MLNVIPKHCFEMLAVKGMNELQKLTNAIFIQDVRDETADAAFALLSRWHREKLISEMPAVKERAAHAKAVASADAAQLHISGMFAKLRTMFISRETRQPKKKGS